MKSSYDNYDLWEATDAHISRPRFGNEPPSGHFYPSEASVKLIDEHGDTVTEGGCLRSAYFRLHGGYKGLPTEARTEYIFLQGKIIEQSLIEMWKEMGLWVANNIKFLDKENGISGELDVVLFEPETQENYIVEVKTFYGYHAEKELFGNYKEKGFPKMSQLLQTLVYINYWRDKGLKFARLVYFARDSVKRRTFKVELEKEGNTLYPKIDGVVLREFSMDDVLARYKTLKDHIQNNTIPPNDYELQFSDAKIEDFYKKGKIAKTKYEDFKKKKLNKNEHIGNWNCSYCKWKEVCWGSK